MRTRPMSSRFMYIAALAALITSVVFVTPARAAGIVVNTATDAVNANNGQCSLREAITAANTDTASGPVAGECAAGSGADAISFAGNYTITLAPALGQLPTVTSPITINGNGAANTVIRAHASPNSAVARIFYVEFGGNLTLNALTIRNGRCTNSCAAGTNVGGGIYNSLGTLTVNNSVISGNSSSSLGGGIYSTGTLNVTNSIISGNSATTGGGGIFNSGTLTVMFSTFSGNTTPNIGGGISNSGTLTVSHSTFNGNSANISGGGIHHSGTSSSIVRNSTFSGNTTGIFGGGIYSTDQSILTVTNSTFANNAANGTGAAGGGVYKLAGAGTLTLRNTIVANSISGGSCSAGITNGGNNLDSGASCGWGSNSGSRSNTNPLLGTLANNGGSTMTLALLPGSPAINTGNPATCTLTDQRGVARPQGGACDIGAYEKTELIFLDIGASLHRAYSLASGQSLRVSYPGVNSGPVRFADTVPGQLLIAAARYIYSANGVSTSYSELMGLPNSQLNTIYWLPWYNNVSLNTQLHFGNVSGSAATVRVFIGGVEMNGSPFNLAAGASTSRSFAGVNNGPVRIQSNVNIVASESVIYRINGVNTSFNEMMALPNSQLNTTYWLPWYNDLGLDTQLRIANVSGATASVRVFIGGVEMNGSPFTLAAGASGRFSFPGVNDGPVRIQSNQNIVAAERVIYTVNGAPTSFSEMMALPNSQLNTIYWFPWYNNLGLDTQLRIANVSGSTATVRVFIGGVEMNGSPFNLAAGTSDRLTFPGVNNGPVRIQSTQNIVAAARLIYTVNGVNTSFSEIMGLPNSLLSTTYWMPLYNNVGLDSQLRFGVP